MNTHHIVVQQEQAESVPTVSTLEASDTLTEFGQAIVTADGEMEAGLSMYADVLAQSCSPSDDVIFVMGRIVVSLNMG